jgi:hypothetical protein
MARFYQIQIGTYYLSRTGTNAAPYAQTQIVGLEDLLTTVIGPAPEPSAGGVPIFQTFAWTKNKAFEVRVNTWLTQSLWANLKTLINDAQENNTSFTVAGIGDTGNFSVTVRPNPQKPFASEGFINGRINKPVFRFLTI